MARRSESKDIHTCRTWLRLFGFKIHGTAGWTREDGAWATIEYWRGRWHATYTAA